MALTYVKDIPDFKTKVAEASPPAVVKLYPDPNNIITSGEHGDSFTYTATSDCYIIFYYICKGGYDTDIKINNFNLGFFYTDQIPMCYQSFLKAGDTFTASTSSLRQMKYYILALKE